MSEFLISWDTNGIEAVVPIGEMREQNIIAKMQAQNPPHDIGSIYHRLTLRARFNPHRNPQLWGINVDDSIDKATLDRMANDFPQVLVDLVKSHGVMLWGSTMEKSAIDY